MSFQAYLDNIEAKTGKTPQQLLNEAKNKGFDPNTKAGEVVSWLAQDYSLGRGHAMAIVYLIKHGPVAPAKHVNSGGVHNDPAQKLRVEGRDN